MDVGDPSSVQALPRTREAHRDSVFQSLLNRSISDLTDRRNRFIPRGVLREVISQQRVKAIIRCLADTSVVEDARLHDIATCISPEEDQRCHCNDSTCTGSRIIFAALVLSGVGLIIQLIPNRDLNRDMVICDSRLEMEGPHHENNNLFNTLPSLFYYWRSQMRAPFLKLRTSEGNSTLDEHIRFDGEVALPWTSLETVQEEARNPSTRVKRVSIHSDHYEMDKKGEYFALKTFDEHAKKSFRGELEANRDIRHNKIVRLLAAFEYRGSYHLLFPWAHGGNLRDVWKRYPHGNSAPSDHTFAWYSSKWLLRQCSGLADALASIHRRTPPREPDGGPSGPPRKLHADIKPENILAYPDDGVREGPYDLKLSDFGLSNIMAGDKVNVNDVARSKTYRPPEYEIECQVDTSYDIWFLGCLFLEFLTWVLLGSDGVTDFASARLHEKDDLAADQFGGRRDQDTFFKKVTKRPAIFTSAKTIRLVSKTKRKPPQKRKSIKRHRLDLEYLDRRIHCEVKDSVISQINNLRSKARGWSDNQLSRFLDFIEDRMLQAEPTKRDNADEVRNVLAGLENEIT